MTYKHRVTLTAYFQDHSIRQTFFHTVRSARHSAKTMTNAPSIKRITITDEGFTVTIFEAD